SAAKPTFGGTSTFVSGIGQRAAQNYFHDESPRRAKTMLVRHDPTSSQSARLVEVSMTRLAIRPIVIAAVVGVSAVIAPRIAAQTITGATAEMERVIVTGSNIPTAQEVGPNPVDTYRPADIERLGIRNATDLLTNLPQEMGTTNTQNS